MKNGKHRLPSCPRTRFKHEERKKVRSSNRSASNDDYHHSLGKKMARKQRHTQSSQNWVSNTWKGPTQLQIEAKDQHALSDR